MAPTIQAAKQQNAAKRARVQNNKIKLESSLSPPPFGAASTSPTKRISIPDPLTSESEEDKKERILMKAEKEERMKKERKIREKVSGIKEEKPKIKKSKSKPKNRYLTDSEKSESEASVEETEFPMCKPRDSHRLKKRIKLETYSAEQAEADRLESIKNKHVEGKWRKDYWKKRPEYMSRGRMALERKYNPLIDLLDIKLVEIDPSEEAGSGLELSSEADDGSDEYEEDKESDTERISAAPRIWPMDVDLTRDASDDSENEASRAAVVVKVEPVVVLDPYRNPDTDDDVDPAPISIKVEIEGPATDDEIDELRVKNPDTEDEADSHMPAVPVKVEFTPESSKSEDVEMAPIENAVVRSTKSYPRIGRGRPRLLIENAAQDAIGPHPLGLDGLAIPTPLNRFLRDYQREGTEFLYRQYSQGIGGILGDDMGLGKTIQVIAFLAAIMKKSNRRNLDKKRQDRIPEWDEDRDGLLSPSSLGPTCLIACPSSVVHNWARELETWGYFDVGIYENNKSNANKGKTEVLSKFAEGYYDIVIGSIHAVRDDIDKLKLHDFTVIVLDEAHKVKNPKSKTTIAFNQFHTILRFALTGTAMQNNHSELWTLLDWCKPGAVGTTKQWELYVTRPLTVAQDSKADEALSLIGRERAVALSKRLLPKFSLRRTKEEVLSDFLTKKRDHIVFCPLTTTQIKVYRRFLQLPEVQDIILAGEPCPCGRTDSDGAPYLRKNCCAPNWHKHILKYMNLFGKVANHLALIYPDNEMRFKDKERYDQDCERIQLAFPTSHERRRKNALSTDDAALCGKWAVLEGLLEEWKSNGDKVLIFSMTLKILDILKRLMESKTSGWRCLDGSTPTDQRMVIVDEFNNDPDVFAFLISTKAGGVGLNLTSANKVVIFDPNWNPAHDLQAMDRAYRYGQKRDVDVYRLVGAGTIEELVYNRQQYKRAQAGIVYDAVLERKMYSGVQGDKDNKGELFGVNNIFLLSDNQSLTKKVIEACDQAEMEWAANNMEFLPEITQMEDLDGDGKPELDPVHGESSRRVEAILAGTHTVISDATLGASKVETAKVKAAAKAAETEKKKKKTKAQVSPKKKSGSSTGALWFQKKNKK